MGAFDNCRYPGQLEVLSTTEDPMMHCKNCSAKTNFPPLFEVACIKEDMHAEKQFFIQQ